jgi:hypothetical protein
MEAVQGAHLYGRRLVLEWAEEEGGLDDLRAKTGAWWGGLVGKGGGLRAELAIAWACGRTGIGGWMCSSKGWQMMLQGRPGVNHPSGHFLTNLCLASAPARAPLQLPSSAETRQHLRRQPSSSTRRLVSRSRRRSRGRRSAPASDSAAAAAAAAMPASSAPPRQPASTCSERRFTEVVLQFMSSVQAFCYICYI